jgi:hypothetical protein
VSIINATAVDEHNYDVSPYVTEGTEKTEVQTKKLAKNLSTYEHLIKTGFEMPS